MSDPLDTLRNDLAEIEFSLNGVYFPKLAKAGADKVLAVLAAASGEQRRALLTLLGYEATEGYEVRWSDGVAYGENYVQFHDVEHELREYVSPVLVLRDQQETTDA